VSVTIEFPDSLTFVIGTDPRSGESIVITRKTEDMPTDAFPWMLQKGVGRCIRDCGGDKLTRDYTFDMQMDKRREFFEFNVMAGMPGTGRGRPSDPILKQLRLDAVDYRMPAKIAAKANLSEIRKHYEQVGLDFDAEVAEIVNRINKKRKLQSLVVDSDDVPDPPEASDTMQEVEKVLDDIRDIRDDVDEDAIDEMDPEFQVEDDIDGNS
jgi:hypothetical protein